MPHFVQVENSTSENHIMRKLREKQCQWSWSIFIWASTQGFKFRENIGYTLLL